MNLLVVVFVVQYAFCFAKYFLHLMLNNKIFPFLHLLLHR